MSQEQIQITASKGKNINANNIPNSKFSGIKPLAAASDD